MAWHLPRVPRRVRGEAPQDRRVRRAVARLDRGRRLRGPELVQVLHDNTSNPVGVVEVTATAEVVEVAVAAAAEMVAAAISSSDSSSNGSSNCQQQRLCKRQS